MSSQSAPDKSDPNRFAVVVDPASWPHDLERLAESVRGAHRALAPGEEVPGLAALLQRLRAGATTVADGWSRERARAMVKALRADGVDAKLSRRRAPRPSGSVPALGVARPLPLKPLPPKRPPAEPTGSGRGAPAPKPPPLPSADNRPTLMDGWQTRAAVRRGSPTESPQEAPPTVQDEAVTAQSTDLRMPALGWGAVLESKAEQAAGAAPSGEQTAPQPSAETSEGSKPDAAVLASKAAAITWGRALSSKTPTATPAVRSSPSESAADEASEASAPEERPDPGSETVPSSPVPALLGNGVAGAIPGRPVPLEQLTPHPWLAALLSGVAPGAGQVYVGHRQEAGRYAVGAPLVLPWINAVRDAHETAAEIARGTRPARGRPQLGPALLFAAAFWVFAVVVIGGGVWAYSHLTRPSAPLEQPSTPAPADDDEGDASEAPGADEPLDTRSLAAEAEARQREARARRLTLRAHQACQLSDWRRCARLSAEARRLDPGLFQAVRLFHRANLALEQGQMTVGIGAGTGTQPAQNSDGEAP